MPAEEEDIHIPEEPREYSSLQEALEDCGLTWPVVPQWMPEGYALEELIVDDVVQRELLFHACYPLSKEEFNAVLALYEASVEPGQYPNHGYRTDDGQIVRRAYCYGIIHTR